VTPISPRSSYPARHEDREQALAHRRLPRSEGGNVYLFLVVPAGAARIVPEMAFSSLSYPFSARVDGFTGTVISNVADHRSPRFS